MQSRNENSADAASSRRWRHRWLVIVPTLACVLITLWLFDFMREREFESQRAWFQERAEDIHDDIQNQISIYQAVMESLRDFQAQSYVGQETFHRLASRMLAREPGVLTLLWIKRVRAAERDGYEASRAEDGDEPFRLTERGADGVLTSAGSRSDYFPLDFIVSRLSMNQAIGFDIGTLATQREALRRACEASQLTATAWSSLTVMQSEQPTVVLYLPTYRQGVVPETGAERRNALDGYFASVVRLSDLMAAATANQKLTQVRFQLYDESAAVSQRQVISSDGATLPWSQYLIPPDREKIAVSKTLNVGGRRWVIVASPTSALIRSSFQQSWLVLWGGLLFSLMVGAWLWTLVGRAARVERLVAERTEELARANRELNEQIVLRQASESALQQQNVELANAHEAKDRFLATMSHELRTPLNAIIGFTGTLLMKLPGPLNEAQQQQLETIQASSRYLLSLINDLLDLAKIESGKVQFAMEPMSCRSIIDEVVATLQPLADAKALKLETVINEDLMARTDRRALSQVIINLANNAIKYTDRGGVTLVLAQRTNKDGEAMAVISVRDTGCGIKPQDQDRLFQAFGQLDTSSTRRHEGTGLGLYLSQRIAVLLGGRIEFSSEPGKGSTFSILVPMEPCSKAPSRASMAPGTFEENTE